MGQNDGLGTMGCLLILPALLSALGLASSFPMSNRCYAIPFLEFYDKIKDLKEHDDGAFKELIDDQEYMLGCQSVKLPVIESKVKTAVDTEKELIGLLDQLEAKIETLEGAHCGHGEFPCHDGYGTCVHNVLACDKIEDCPNGHDEDNATCVNPFEKGSVWNGTMVYDRCTQRQPTYFRLTIVDEHPQDYFPSDVVVEADVFLAGDDIRDDFHIAANFRLHGDYYYGTRQLIFPAPEDDGLGLLVQHDGHHMTEATSWTVREASLKKCAEIHLRRED